MLKIQIMLGNPHVRFVDPITTRSAPRILVNVPGLPRYPMARRMRSWYRTIERSIWLMRLCLKASRTHMIGVAMIISEIV